MNVEESLTMQSCTDRAEFLHVKPGKGAAFVRSKLKNYVTNNTVERTFRAGEQAGGMLEAQHLVQTQTKHTILLRRLRLVVLICNTSCAGAPPPRRCVSNCVPRGRCRKQPNTRVTMQPLMNVRIRNLQVGIADISRSDAQFTYNDGSDVSATL